MFSRVLQTEGYAVDAVETGKEALNRILSNSYNAVLIEADLSDMDGTELLVKLNNYGAKMFKIIITDNLTKDSEAFLKGADAFLVKPVSPSKLILLLNEKLGG